MVEDGKIKLMVGSRIDIEGRTFTVSHFEADGGAVIKHKDENSIEVLVVHPVAEKDRLVKL